MRVQMLIAGFLAALEFGLSAGAQQPAPVSAGQLVRDVVFNELNDHSHHGYWRYWVKRRTASGTRLDEQVETPQGPLTRLIETNGQPIDRASRQQEEARLERLIVSPQEQARHLQQYNEDEQRIGRILALLPDAFLYEYDGSEEDGWYRLHFRPNPSFPAHSIEARVFHAMTGELWVDASAKRLARLEGHVAENVDFGFGLLGRLYKGGWFRLVRTQVDANDWKTTELEVHMSIRALLVKTFARETSEDRGGFTPVPAGLVLPQALALLNQAGDGAPTASSRPIAAALAFRP